MNNAGSKATRPTQTPPHHGYTHLPLRANNILLICIVFCMCIFKKNKYARRNYKSVNITIKNR